MDIVTYSEAGALGTAFSGIADNIGNGLTTVAPYALGIVGTFLVWRYGVKFFKGLSK